MQNVGIITRCEVCDSGTVIPVLDLGKQPLCDDLIPVGNPAECTLYPVELLACPTCTTIHQKYQVEKKILFPKSYHYRAAMTQDVLTGMKELVGLATETLGELKDKVVVDIGCNDGSLLNIFKKVGGAKLTVGIEPTGAATDAVARVDHVINDEHRFEDLNGVIASLNALKSDKTIIIIENHYLGAVMERNQFDTFYHEHPRTYSYNSFRHIARKLGMAITHVDFPQRYNGNIRIVLRSGEREVARQVDESSFIDGFASMKQYIDDYRGQMRERLGTLVKQYGPLPAKAFPGRASIIISYFGLDEQTIGQTFERTGSMKIDHYIPGTRIPIRDEAAYFAKPDAPVIVNLAWHIKNEIHAFMRQHKHTGEIIEIFS
ncbi:MAG: DUF1698 domain-containing protein [Verrucomicrobiaceae bacterium]|nr:MAG: DUF1698 domain-containing protein [Verrucomicrobiaceae bacterium]